MTRAVNERSRRRRAVAWTQLRLVVAIIIVALLVGVLFAGRDLWGAHTKAVQQAGLLANRTEIASTVTWLPDKPGLSRPVEDKTRRLVTDVYALAWASIDAGQVGDELKQSLSGPALIHAWSDLNTREQSAALVKTKHVKHTLVATYYSEDGSIMAIEAPEIVRIQTVSASGSDQQSGLSTTTVHKTVETFRFLARQHDGEWRIELIERRGHRD